MLKDDIINIFGIIYLYTMGFVNTTKPNASENYPTFFMTSISVIVSMKTQSLMYHIPQLILMATLHCV